MELENILNESNQTHTKITKYLQQVGMMREVEYRFPAFFASFGGKVKGRWKVGHRFMS